jgi:hypothetical protein
MSAVATLNVFEIVKNSFGAFIILLNGVPVKSKRFGDEHQFSTRAGARKMVSRLRRGNLSI